MNYTKIVGTGSYLPEKILTNADLEKIIDTSDEWITERTGIKQRHVAEDHETCSTMAYSASLQALESAQLTAEDIDLIIVGTCTPDRMFPSTACFLQKHLGIKKNIIAFDLSAACAGFLYALSTADQFIRAGTVKRALVVGADVLTRILDWTDRRTCVLFGDGAGAAVVEVSESPGIYSSHLYAQGGFENILYLTNKAANKNNDSPYLHMDGKEVFKLAVNALGDVAEEALSANRLSCADIDWLVPHQANLRIIKSTAKKLQLPMERVILTVADHGNTSAASIPLALDQAIRDGRIQRGHKLLLEAIGGGLAWGSILLKY
jgi:3-oxoacyl-[acyl-carrier-protein] synthase-3